jgi:hypothetical protein
VGIHFGALSPAGGRLVEGPLSESPAEAAGVVRGDRVLEVRLRAARSGDLAGDLAGVIWRSGPWSRWHATPTDAAGGVPV